MTPTDAELLDRLERALFWKQPHRHILAAILINKIAKVRATRIVDEAKERAT